MTAIAILVGLAVASGAGAGADPADPPRVDDLVAAGFVVVKRTRVDGDFDGCDYGRQVPLQSGGVFTCNGFSYMHAHNPPAVLLKSQDGHTYKLVIENVVYDGAFS